MIEPRLSRIWFGGEMPDEFKRYGERWAELHPDWEIIEWTDDSALPPLRNQELFDRAEELQPRDSKRWKSDVLRLELLYLYGGVYVDTDSEPLRPLDPLLEGVEAFTAYSPNRGPNGERLANNGTMGTVAGHPFFDALIERLPEWVQAHRGKRTAVAVGPYYISHVLNSQEWPDVTVFDEGVFYPRSVADRRNGRKVDLSGAWTDHVWATTRDRDRRGKC